MELFLRKRRREKHSNFISVSKVLDFVLKKNKIYKVVDNNSVEKILAAVLEKNIYGKLKIGGIKNGVLYLTVPHPGVSGIINMKKNKLLSLFEMNGMGKRISNIYCNVRGS